MCSEEEFSEESEDEGERERDAAALKELVKEEPNEELSGVGDSSDEQTDEMSESRRKRVCLFCVCYSGNQQYRKLNSLFYICAPPSLEQW